MIDVGPVVEKGCHSGGLEWRPIAVIPLFRGGLGVRFFQGTQEPPATKACEGHRCTPPERVSAQRQSRNFMLRCGRKQEAAQPSNQRRKTYWLPRQGPSSVVSKTTQDIGLWETACA